MRSFCLIIYWLSDSSTCSQGSQDFNKINSHITFINNKHTHTYTHTHLLMYIRKHSTLEERAFDGTMLGDRCTCGHPEVLIEVSHTSFLLTYADGFAHHSWCRKDVKRQGARECSGMLGDARGLHMWISWWWKHEASVEFMYMPEAPVGWLGTACRVHVTRGPWGAPPSPPNIFQIRNFQ